MRAPSARVEVAAVNPRRGFVVLLVVLVACVLIMSAQAPARGGHGTVLRSWLLTGSAPFTTAAGSISRSISGAIDHTAELFTARSENERLRRDLDASRRELFLLRARVEQADEARRLEAGGAAMPNIVRTVPLLLVERRSGTYSAIVGAGAAEGVVPGSPLAVPGGLVGRVVTVGRGISRAQLLLDASAAAGARIARTGELGVVRGDGRGGLLLNNIGLASTVAKGDLVESAGIDGIYPRGVEIGRVEDVTRGGKLFLEIRVAPSADFARLTDVLLLAPSPAVRESADAQIGETAANRARPAPTSAASRATATAPATARPTPAPATPRPTAAAGGAPPVTPTARTTVVRRSPSPEIVRPTATMYPLQSTATPEAETTPPATDARQ